MTRLRTLGFAVVTVAMTALAIVGVNAFVPWLMHSLLTNPKLAAALSHLSWMVTLFVAVFTPMAYGWYRRRTDRAATADRGGGPTTARSAGSDVPGLDRDPIRPGVSHRRGVLEDNRACG